MPSGVEFIPCIMDKAKAQIERLEEVRFQIRCWRYGSTAVIGFLVLASFGMMNDGFQGLIKPGSKQTEFFGDLNKGLSNEVAPIMEQGLARAITASQSSVRTEIAALQSRVPEVAGTLFVEIDKVRTMVPAAYSFELHKSVQSRLKEKEPILRQWTPDASGASVREFAEKFSEAFQRPSDLVAIAAFNPFERKCNKSIDLLVRLGLKAKERNQSTNWEDVSLALDLLNEKPLQTEGLK